MPDATFEPTPIAFLVTLGNLHATRPGKIPGACGVCEGFGCYRLAATTGGDQATEAEQGHRGRCGHDVEAASAFDACVALGTAEVIGVDVVVLVVGVGDINGAVGVVVGGPGDGVDVDGVVGVEVLVEEGREGEGLDAGDVVVSLEVAGAGAERVDEVDEAVNGAGVPVGATEDVVDRAGKADRARVHGGAESDQGALAGLDGAVTVAGVGDAPAVGHGLGRGNSSDASNSDQGSKLHGILHLFCGRPSCRALPDESRDKRYAALSEMDQWKLRMLAGILRIADGIDRNHLSDVENIQCSTSRTQVVITLSGTTKRGLSTNMKAAQEKSDLLAHTLSKDVVIEIVKKSKSEQEKTE